MLCGNKDKHIVAFIAAQQVTVGRLKHLKKLPSNSLMSLSNYNRKVSFYRGSNSWFDRDEYFLRNAANSLEFSNYFLGELWAMKHTVEALPSPKCWCSHLFTDLFHLSANTYVNFTNTGWGPQRAHAQFDWWRMCVQKKSCQFECVYYGVTVNGDIAVRPWGQDCCKQGCLIPRYLNKFADRLPYIKTLYMDSMYSRVHTVDSLCECAFTT